MAGHRLCHHQCGLPGSFNSSRFHFKEELPVGIQVAGPPRGDGQAIRGAKVLEDVLGLKGSTPIDPKGA